MSDPAPAWTESALPAAGPRATLIAAALLITVVVAAYCNSFSVPFVFDDIPAVVDNPTIRHLGRMGDVLVPPHETGTTVNGRPLLNLTLALNYAFGKLDVRGYHAVNLAIHLATALLLMGVVRRTLAASRLRVRFAAHARPLAFAIAALWALHPLATEAVTYVVQRAEALAALFLLLTLYTFIRSLESARSRVWRSLAVTACVAGMATKETAAVAPILAILYDRTFVVGSLREAWRRRGAFYLALAASWALLAILVVAGGGRGGTVGLESGVSMWNYGLTQAHAIPMYLRLALWPNPQVFDYGIDVVRRIEDVLPEIALLLGIVAGIAWSWRRYPAMSFAGAWFLVLLAPSSSVIPIATQTMAEHRMYLPLVAPVAVAVLSLAVLIGRRAVAPLAGLMAAAACLAAQRNHTYRSELALWHDTVVKRPENARAQNNVGNALVTTGAVAAAMPYFERALALLPDYPETHDNLGYALTQTGHADAAVGHFEAALRLRPDNFRAHANFGNALVQLNRLTEAKAQFQQALRLRPDVADSHWGLGNALAQSGDKVGALAEYERALALDPAYADAHYSLAVVLAPDHPAEARRHYEIALGLKPRFPEAHNNFGNLLLRQGDPTAAIEHFRAAVALEPANAEARTNLGNALLSIGQPAAAAAEFERVLVASPGYLDARFGHASACVALSRWTEAIADLRAVIRGRPNDIAARANLGNALLVTGNVAEAIATYTSALQLDPGNTVLQTNLAQARALQSGEAN